MSEKSKPEPKPEAPAPVPPPFHPPRIAGEWVLGPNGPQRKE